MLNRRILRAKAMQTVYAYRQAVQSDYQLALENIGEAFVRNLNSMEVHDPKKLETNRKWATFLFEENYEKQTAPADKDAPAEVRQVAVTAIDLYHKQCQRDARFLGNTMLQATEKIYDYYLLSLWLVLEIADQVQREEKDQQQRYLKEAPTAEKPLKLTGNPVVQAIRDSKEFQDNRIRRNVHDLLESGLVRRMYNELKRTEEYAEYRKNEQPEYETEWNMVAETVKTVLFKSEPAAAFWQQLDSSWEQNETTVRGMFNKTMQSVNENPENFELQNLTQDWEADREFFQSLYNTTVEKFDEYEALIANKTTNWDVERVAQVDKVVLVMAITELLNFPSIPVKVSINEYIDLSKTYSTPKSKQFVNGILDALAGDLSEQGVLKKSGRGLIDNK